MTDALMIAYAPCIRCGTVFGFDPETVTSTSVHIETRCCLHPDGRQVRPGDENTTREPVCATCYPIHLIASQAPIAVRILFPQARFDLIDVDAAIRHAKERESHRDVYSSET